MEARNERPAIAVGKKIFLRSDCGYGSLSTRFLDEHGAFHVMVEVTTAPLNGNGRFNVKLPDGYILDVDERDIL